MKHAVFALEWASTCTTHLDQAWRRAPLGKTRPMVLGRNIRCINRNLLMGLMAAFLAGCASTSVVAPARSASNSEAVFYVIRKDYPPTAWTGDLMVNGEVSATMRDDSYVKVNVPVGQSSIGLKFAPLLGFSNEPFRIEVFPNQTRYLVFTGDVRLAEYKSPYIIMKWSLQAHELSEAAAKPLLEKLPTAPE